MITFLKKRTIPFMIAGLWTLLLFSLIKCTHSGTDTRMTWWREARFGMFIHWGLYAIPAGEWKGEEQDRGARFLQ